MIDRLAQDITSAASPQIEHASMHQETPVLFRLWGTNDLDIASSGAASRLLKVAGNDAEEQPSTAYEILTAFNDRHNRTKALWAHAGHYLQ